MTSLTHKNFNNVWSRQIYWALNNEDCFLFCQLLITMCCCVIINFLSFCIADSRSYDNGSNLLQSHYVLICQTNFRFKMGNCFLISTVLLFKKTTTLKVGDGSTSPCDLHTYKQQSNLSQKLFSDNLRSDDL